MSDPKPLDVDRESVIRLLDDATARYCTAFKEGHNYNTGYWDGQCRAFELILEMENE